LTKGDTTINGRNQLPNNKRGDNLKIGHKKDIIDNSSSEVLKN
jgi:hypothetical protein